MFTTVILERQTVPPTLPHASRDVELQQVVDYIRATLSLPPGVRFFYVGETTPTADYTDLLWLEVSGAGAPEALRSYNPTTGIWDAVAWTVPHIITVYADGTPYTLTNTPAALNFGTTDPAIVVDEAGTYSIRARVRLDYVGATFVDERTVTLALRRTNNTPGDIIGCQLKTDIVTTSDATMASAAIPEVIYTTANNDDALTIYADVSVVPSAGDLKALEAEIIAVRLY